MTKFPQPTSGKILNPTLLHWAAGNHKPKLIYSILDGRVIPAGVDFVIAIAQIHRDPDIYPDPFVWNPDNFAPERVAKRSPHAFLPFGFGPRLCMGKFQGVEQFFRSNI